jgi:hypothetical protein
MKSRISQRLLLLGAIALVGLWMIPAAHAADDERRKAEQKKQEDDLKRYDRNGNGKLDPDEEAARRADEAKEKSGRERKKR